MSFRKIKFLENFPLAGLVNRNEIVRRSLEANSSDFEGLHDVRDGIKKYVNSIMRKSFCIAPGKVCLPGPPGPKGVQGPRGKRGPKGTKGKKGTQGSMGPPGEPGKQGMMGDPGVPGVKGEKGMSAFREFMLLRTIFPYSEGLFKMIRI